MNPIQILLDLEESGAITRKEGQDVLRKAYLKLGERRYKTLIEKNKLEEEENSYEVD